MERNRHAYTPEFKKQIIHKYANEKSKRELVEEKGLTFSTLNRWIL
ncbi:transposase [Paenibacillus sp. 481]|nr:transposase [Paenibacillus sp. 481]